MKSFKSWKIAIDLELLCCVVYVASFYILIRHHNTATLGQWLLSQRLLFSKKKNFLDYRIYSWNLFSDFQNFCFVVVNGSLNKNQLSQSVLIFKATHNWQPYELFCACVDTTSVMYYVLFVLMFQFVIYSNCEVVCSIDSGIMVHPKFDQNHISINLRGSFWDI